VVVGEEDLAGAEGCFCGCVSMVVGSEGCEARGGERGCGGGDERTRSGSANLRGDGVSWLLIFIFKLRASSFGAHNMRAAEIPRSSSAQRGNWKGEEERTHTQAAHQG